MIKYNTISQKYHVPEFVDKYAEQKLERDSKLQLNIMLANNYNTQID